MSHARLDAVSLDIARRIADGLPEHPEWLRLARHNVERWSNQHKDVPSLVQCYAEWHGILERPVADIAAILTAETDEGQRLRQNSPFAGVLTPREVWDIKARHRHATPAA